MSLLMRAMIAPLRVGAHPRTLELLFDEPLLLAAHYAAVYHRIPRSAWPEEIADRLQQLDLRYQAHDSVLTLMDSLRGQLPTAVSVDLARRLAEGMELHSLLQARREVYQECCAKTLATLLKAVGKEDETSDVAVDEDTAEGRLTTFCRVMAFTPAESRLLGIVLTLGLSPGLQLFASMLSSRADARTPIWRALLDVDARGLTKLLSPSGALMAVGLLQPRDKLPRLSDFWSDFLIRNEGNLVQGLVQVLEPKESPDGAARLPDDDREILQIVLQKREPGINVLLYGKAGVDKLRLARTLVEGASGTAYTLVPEIPEEDHPTAILVGQRLLAGTGNQPILVVEKAASVLSRAQRDDLLFFGIRDEEESACALDERLLSGNLVPTLWLAGDARRLHAETLTRFLFHAEALKGTRADRTALVESMIDSLPISTREKTELAKLEGLSAPQLVGARRLATMTGGGSRPTFARHFRIAAGRSQKALSRRHKDEARLPVTQYSLDYIHAAGRFGPSQILKALQQRPVGSLCLYGLPGTGKTQFAEYLAQELGKPLLIKRASELLDKYVGESEKRIGEAFDQAEEEGAILLLDEADSFLRDRSRSQHAWEVSTVNELLQRMERFEEIFIGTTNVFDQIDTAALRRFTFKLEFLPLTLEQRWAMFLNETGLRGKSLSEKRQLAYEERLAFMKDLTPGDFATVKRQCVLLGESLSPEDWLGQLELEVKAKSRAGTENATSSRGVV